MGDTSARIPAPKTANFIYWKPSAIVAGATTFAVLGASAMPPQQSKPAAKQQLEQIGQWALALVGTIANIVALVRDPQLLLLGPLMLWGFCWYVRLSQREVKPDDSTATPAADTVPCWNWLPILRKRQAKPASAPEPCYGPAFPLLWRRIAFFTLTRNSDWVDDCGRTPNHY